MGGCFNVIIKEMPKIPLVSSLLLLFSRGVRETPVILSQEIRSSIIIEGLTSGLAANTKKEEREEEDRRPCLGIRRTSRQN